MYVSNTVMRFCETVFYEHLYACMTVCIEAIVGRLAVIVVVCVCVFNTPFKSC